MKAINSDTLNYNDYYFPFEGEEHLGTILMLPFRKDVWYKNSFPALSVYKKIIQEISNYETVFLFIHPSIDEKIVKEFELKNVIIYRIPYDDCWARDVAPIFLKKHDDEPLLGLDFNFNAYGGEYNGLYYPYENDKNFAKNVLLDLLISKIDKRNLILEGGSVLSNGKGVILTTSECLLSKGRNPSLTKDEIESELLKAFNAKKIIFLPFGILDDETSGHVDNVASFLDEKTILLAYEEDINNLEYQRSETNYQFLLSQSDQNGEKFNIIKMPFPKKMYLSADETTDLLISPNSKNRLLNSPLAGSYINFYQSKDFILLPQYNDSNDQRAIDILNSFYNNRKKIIPINSRDILLGGGNIHCITMQIPYSSCYSYLMEAKNDY